MFIYGFNTAYLLPQIRLFTKMNVEVTSVTELDSDNLMVIHRNSAPTSLSLPDCSLGIAIHTTAVSGVQFGYVYFAACIVPVSPLFSTPGCCYRMLWSRYLLIGSCTAIRY